MSFIYTSITFYKQHLNITCKICTSISLEVTGSSHSALFPLTLKSSLDTNFVNIFNSHLSMSNPLTYLSLKFQVSNTHFCSSK